MTEIILRTDIEPHIDLAQLAARLHAKPDTVTYRRAAELFEQAKPLLKPGYIIRCFPLTELTADSFMLGGQMFHSRVAAKMLKNQRESWVYIATSGREISEYIAAAESRFDQYLLDQIAYFACMQAMDTMLGDISLRLGIGRHMRLSPGSIIDWSVAEVKTFFTLLDGDYQRLNLRVLDSGMIDPLKSVSGILFPTEVEFASCDICSRANCSDRKTLFNEDKYYEMINL